MWRLVLIHASTGAGEICHDFNSPNYLGCGNILWIIDLYDDLASNSSL